MIPQRVLTYLSIFLVLLTSFSCQKKVNNNNKQTNTKAEVKKLIAVGDRFYENKQFDSAFHYYNKSKSICNPKIDPENYVTSLNNMADIQQNHGDYTGSESIATKAIPYLRGIKNPKHQWNSYTILGINYLNTYDYNNALLYFNKALALKTSHWRKQAAKNNIAIVYMLQKRNKEALEIFLPLVQNISLMKYPQDRARALDNIGVCYYELGDSKALSYLKRGLQLRSEIKYDWGLGTSYFHLAEFYQKENPSLAKKYSQLAYEKFTIINNVDDRLIALKFLIKNSPADELKKYALLYIKINDSITEVRQKAKNQFAKIKYDSKIEKDENLKLRTHKVENELQLERQKNRNIISYIIIALSLGLILVLYFYLTSRGNREKIEATYESETRISKKLHDELANDVYHTMAFAENKNLSLAENKEQLLNNLDAIYSRTRDISKENSLIVTNEKYVFYLKEMISGFKTPNVNLILNGLDSIVWDEIGRNKKIAIYRVIQELLVNMKKHSHATLVGITFKKTNKKIVVSYTDNGKGIDTNKMSFKNGLYNVENRIQNNKGEIDIESTPNKGFKVYFNFPLS